jgi:hypothetical protein
MHLLKTAAIAAAICFVGTAAMAASLPARPMYEVIPATRHITVPGPSISPLPSFTYNAKDPLTGTAYSGAILGGSPTALSSTSLPVQIVPLQLVLNDGTKTVTYNPTAHDPCNGGLSETDYVARSPLFSQRVRWTMNGIKIGQTQYIDAFQRAQFWSVVHGSNYHLLFSRTQLPKQHATLGPTLTANVSGGILCGYAGQTDMGMVDGVVQKIIRHALKSSINVGTFPVFLLHNVFMTENSGSSCCVLGYHGGLYVNGKLQVYAVADVDSAGFFPGTDDDTTTLSHELAEAVNDPTGGNQVPTWFNGHFCQPNLEVGDPLAGSELPPIILSGTTYHVQELTFAAWFFHTASHSAGKLYSDNGTQTTYANQCT